MNKKLSKLDTKDNANAFAKEIAKKVHKIDVYNEGTIRTMKNISNNLKKSLDIPMSGKD